MALAFDAASGANGSSVSSLTFSHTITGSDPVLSVLTGINNNIAVTGITYNGVALTQVSGAAQSGVNTYTDAWLIIGPATGANNVVVTWASAGSRTCAIGISLSGGHQTTQPDIGGGATATGTSVSTTLSLTADQCWGIDCIGGANAGPTPDAGQTARNEQSPSFYNLRASTEGPDGTGNATMGWTFAADSVAQSLVFIKPAAAANGWGPLLALRNNRLVQA